VLYYDAVRTLSRRRVNVEHKAWYEDNTTGQGLAQQYKLLHSAPGLLNATSYSTQTQTTDKRINNTNTNSIVVNIYK